LNNHKNALKAAFPHTIPVMAGFLFLGMAYGILMGNKGYGVGWAVLFSLVAYAGSAQYVAITFLTTPFAYPYGISEALAIFFIVVLHYWKENSLISIGGGTLLYMFLVQMVFVL